MALRPIIAGKFYDSGAGIKPLIAGNLYQSGSGLRPIISGQFYNQSSGGFEPPDIGGCLVWLDASRIVGLSDGDPVATWVDSSGNSKDATQATGTKQPSYQTNEKNSLPVVRFDGGDGLATPNITIGPRTIFAVYKATGAGFIYEISTDSNGGNGGYLYTETGNSIFVTRGGTGSGKNYMPAVSRADGTWRYVSHVFDGTDASHVLFENGVSTALAAGSASGNPGTATISQPVYVGSRGAAAVFLTGDIAELIIYNTALSTADRQTVEAYLAAKWAI